MDARLAHTKEDLIPIYWVTIEIICRKNMERYYDDLTNNISCLNKQIFGGFYYVK